MTKRYAVRIELTDGTLEEAACYLDRKDTALKVAREHAKSKPWGATRVWVDDTRTDLGVKTFEV
jgi:hypothetical protein